jgi:hypothetical protein
MWKLERNDKSLNLDALNNIIGELNEIHFDNVFIQVASDGKGIADLTVSFFAEHCGSITGELDMFQDRWDELAA